MDFIYKENSELINSRKHKTLTRIKDLVNKTLRYLNVRLEMNVVPDGTSQMITIEQSINLQSLVDQSLFYNVEGELVELGCHTGESARQIQYLNKHYGYPKKLHVFDRFNLVEDTVPEIKEKLLETFRINNLNAPVVHEGFLKDTLTSELPKKIAFIHIDIGCGDSQKALKNTLLFILEEVYPHLSPGGICLLADYHDPYATSGGTDSNPGVKIACDDFFSGRSENINVLYGNHYSHGFFRKKLNVNEKLPAKASGNNYVLHKE